MVATVVAGERGPVESIMKQGDAMCHFFYIKKIDSSLLNVAKCL